jgi:predicted ribosome quality control (RQC) complex YloA/Tae2 family protein
MKVTLDISKSLEDNAKMFYESAKKAKRKLEGVKKAYKKTLERIETLKEKKDTYIPEKTKIKQIERKKDWYEKFRWFISSEGFMCIGGRDATTNDIIVKKHIEGNDLVFHTDIAGSPFFVIKSEGKEIGQATINETYEACASFSRAWKSKVTTTEVFYVKPDQVTNEGGLPKGTFMIHGKRNYGNPTIQLALGIYNNRPMCGPINAIKKNCKDTLYILQGDKKKSDVAKKIKKYYFDKYEIELELNDILSVLPPGDCELS